MTFYRTLSEQIQPALPRPIYILQVYYANHLTLGNLNRCQLLSELSKSHLDILSDQIVT